MDGYERIIQTIQQTVKETNKAENETNSRIIPYIAEMQSDGRCDIGELVIEKEDYYIAECLTTDICSKVSVDSYLNDCSQYNKALKEGDIVLVFRIGEDFIIADKLLEGENVSI